MSDDREADEVYWIEPKRRAIMPLHGFHISHSLAKTIRRERFRVTANRDFAGIVRLCAEAAPDRPSTWINHPIERAYRHLHEIGFAHRSEEHTSELQSLMRISYAVFCLNKKKRITTQITSTLKHRTVK